MTYIRKIKVGIATLAMTVTGAIQGSEGCAPSQACCQQPCACSCGRYFLDAEVLFLRASEGGLSSVCDSITITDTTVGGTVVSTLDGTGRDPDFDWDFGFRVGAGYELPCCPCD